jgi:anti-sigma B factor antagonist
MVAIPRFRATVAEVGGQIALVSASGELDLHVEAEVRDALASAAALTVPTVVVDLSGVSSMDSTVCGIIVAESKRLRREQRTLVLVSNGNLASRVLEVSGFDQVVPIYPTLHVAFQKLLLESVL